MSRFIRKSASYSGRPLKVLSRSLHKSSAIFLIHYHCVCQRVAEFRRPDCLSFGTTPLSILPRLFCASQEAVARKSFPFFSSENCAVCILQSARTRSIKELKDRFVTVEIKQRAALAQLEVVWFRNTFQLLLVLAMEAVCLKLELIISLI